MQLKLHWDQKAAMLLSIKNSVPPTVTKDGVSVAKEVELEDPIENLGSNNGS